MTDSGYIKFAVITPQTSHAKSPDGSNHIGIIQQANLRDILQIYFNFLSDYLTCEIIQPDISFIAMGEKVCSILVYSAGEPVSQVI